MPRYGIPVSIGETLPKFLEEAWSLNVLNFEEIEEGYDNLNILVSTTLGKFVLRWYSFRTVADIHFELETIAKCREVGFPVASVLPNKNGQLFEVLDGRPAAIFEYVEGQHPSLENADRRKAGQWLAEYHQALSGFRPSHPRAYGEFSELQRTKKYEQAMLQLGYSDFLDDLRTLETRYLPKFEEALVRLPQGVVHGDFYPGNLLINGDNLVALLDFDTCFWGTLVRDVADSVLQWSRPDTTFLQDLTTRSEIVEGYQRIRRLTSDELELLPTIHLLACYSDAVRYLVSQIDAGDPRPLARDCHMYCCYKELERDFLREGVL